MRRLAPPVFLALLAACSVTTTGAPCGSDLNCPTGQGCGSDGTCSSAALSCPGHTESGQCVPGTSCASGRLVTCSQGPGVCSTGPVETDCPTHQQCATSGGIGACACSPSRCSATTSSYCGAGGEIVDCAQDTSNAKGCWYAASSTACGDPGKTCAESGGATSCTCPAANTCPALDAVQCGVANQQILRCLPSVAGSACLTWQPATDCAASGLVCSAGACACPANPGPVFHADADSGSPMSATPRPTGVASPGLCRFATLTDALQAAGPSATVKAVGWTAIRPAGAMVFTEPGAISIGAGARLTTDDPALSPDHYVVTTAAALGGPFVSIGSGGTLEGFELRNEASTGPGVQTSCGGASDVAPVSLSGVRVVATAGAPAVRFASGVHVNGDCGVVGSNLTVTGAGTGIQVDPASATVESTFTAPHLSASTGAGLALVDGTVTFIGGTVDGNGSGALVGTTGTGTPSFTATGTAFTGNAGDAVFVARGTLVTDGCPFGSNGTHVHVEPAIGAPLSVTVRNSRGPARMAGAADSALRVIAAGLAIGSSLSIQGNDILQNSAIQTYTLGTFVRRGGGLVFTSPMPSFLLFEGNTVASNAGDQILVAASGGTLDLRGGASCDTPTNNSIGCYSLGAVGVYSNGTTVQIDRNHWSQQPAVPTVDYAGSGITGTSSVCTPSALVCQ